MHKLLYSHGSPYARRVRIALLEKGLGFESNIDDRVRPIEEFRQLVFGLGIDTLGRTTLFSEATS